MTIVDRGLKKLGDEQINAAQSLANDLAERTRIQIAARDALAAVLKPPTPPSGGRNSLRRTA